MRKTEYINRIVNASDNIKLAEIKNTNLTNADNIYYNVRINNNIPLSSMPIVFSENRVQPILTNPNDYELAVVRFKISTLGLPIMIWASQPAMSVTISYGPDNYTTPLTFIPNGTAGSVYGEAIFNFQEFIDIINSALLASFTAMKTAHPVAPQTQAPFLEIDHTTNLINLLAEQSYANPPVVANNVNIYMNEELYFFFPSLQSFASSDPITTYRLVVKDRVINGSTFLGQPYYTMASDFPVFALWNDYQSISFESNTIPIVPENQPAQTNVITSLITDFEPLEQENNRTAFQYFPQGPLRYYSLSSHYPLTQIDVRVYWQDKFGRSFPLYLPFGELCTIKILFRKKSVREFEDAFGTTLSLEDRR